VHEEFDYPEGPSRTALKREAEALQALGKELVALPPARLKEVPLSEALADAVRLAQRITANGGRRRQLQLIGKLMRREDPEPIRAALDRIHNRSREAVAEQHLAERWRGRLLEDPAASSEFMALHPQTDQQRLRQLIRAAQQEQARDKPPRAARELFRLVRDVLSAG
jgi:ribosome-associated protein